LILFMPRPGMLTQRSRGNETTMVRCALGSTCTSMIVSDRRPVSTAESPKAVAARSLATNSRESDPTTR